ncbi:hypothetical protein [Flavobacterium sp. LC2016-12]|uniref:hypothetical protein n=1 Tax=Flavobacterium sp. LC2016-12 TaxID=2783794 RepID=UPI00188D181A|nr:hypothetical protein [Flavobacterium sp. LC2016-12]MBF4465600.1 hypothetical protein [Flavobacterium sp. LC2016-12]
MEKILMEVKDKLVLVDDNTEITSRTLRPLYPNPNPGVPFIWSTCLQNISLSGLQNSSFFKKEIGTFDSSGNPTIIIDTIKMNNYNQYNNLCKNVLRQ